MNKAREMATDIGATVVRDGKAVIVSPPASVPAELDPWRGNHRIEDIGLSGPDWKAVSFRLERYRDVIQGLDEGLELLSLASCNAGDPSLH